MIFQHFGYNQPHPFNPISADMPLENSILMRYENVAANASGTTWRDTSGLGYTTGSVQNGAFLSAGDNAAVINYYTTNNEWFQINATTNVSLKSMCVLFNREATTYGTTSYRNYFWDLRSANDKTPTDNGGFFNQYDGVASGTSQLYYNGEYWSYDENDASTTGPLATTSANLTNGTGNDQGGTATYQWLGPNGRSAYTPKRLWLMNFNPSRPLDITTTSYQNKGARFGANDNGTEGSSMLIYSIIGWNTTFSTANFNQLVNYYKSQGLLV